MKLDFPIAAIQSSKIANQKKEELIQCLDDLNFAEAEKRQSFLERIDEIINALEKEYGVLAITKDIRERLYLANHKKNPDALGIEMDEAYFIKYAKADYESCLKTNGALAPRVKKVFLCANGESYIIASYLNRIGGVFKITSYKEQSQKFKELAGIKVEKFKKMDKAYFIKYAKDDYESCLKINGTVRSGVKKMFLCANGESCGMWVYRKRIGELFKLSSAREQVQKFEELAGIEVKTYSEMDEKYFKKNAKADYEACLKANERLNYHVKKGFLCYNGESLKIWVYLGRIGRVFNLSSIKKQKEKFKELAGIEIKKYAKIDKAYLIKNAKADYEACLKANGAVYTKKNCKFLCKNGETLKVWIYLNRIKKAFNIALHSDQVEKFKELAGIEVKKYAEMNEAYFIKNAKADYAKCLEVNGKVTSESKESFLCANGEKYKMKRYLRRIGTVFKLTSVKDELEKLRELAGIEIKKYAKMDEAYLIKNAKADYEACLKLNGKVTSSGKMDLICANGEKIKIKVYLRRIKKIFGLSTLREQVEKFKELAGIEVKTYAEMDEAYFIKNAKADYNKCLEENGRVTSVVKLRFLCANGERALISLYLKRIGIVFKLSSLTDQTEKFKVLAGVEIVKYKKMDEEYFINNAKVDYKSCKQVNNGVVRYKSSQRFVCFNGETLSLTAYLNRLGKAFKLSSIKKKLNKFEQLAGAPAWLHRKEKEEKEKIKTDIIDFIEDIQTRKEKDARDFRTLINVFQGNNIMDILYFFHPHYRGVAVEDAKGIVAKYLGTYLIEQQQREFSYKNVIEAVPYLTDNLPESLQRALQENIKSDVLHFYYQEKKEGTKEDDIDIILKYLTKLEENIKGSESKMLHKIFEETMEYYVKLFKIEKPEHIVDELREGRLFPDLNQLINISETVEKKRMLIADEMGLGKSASSILTWEQIKKNRGLEKGGQAVVVVPSNVIDTWQIYLSDYISKEGKQEGYFKPGQGPKVVTITSVNDFETEQIKNADYIIMSQSKLNNEYGEGIKSLHPDMIIVDEIHKLKNEQGKWSENMLDITESMEDDQYLNLLSGTPIPNKVSDLAMIFKFLYPEQAGNKNLTKQIIDGDVIDIRNKLIPRMQMKKLNETINMPEITKNVVYIELSKEERRLYDILLENDELTSTTKIQVLMQFLLNPKIMDVLPNTPMTKMEKVREYVIKTLKEKKKMVMFINNYIKGVLTGENNVVDQFDLPEDVIVHKVHGEDDKKLRPIIQRELNTTKQKVFLAVSGATADVGVDYSGAATVDFYNEPWTMSDMKQMIARVWRYGVKNPVSSTTFIVKDTIEEGVHKYLQIKQDAIGKILHGIPRTDLEKQVLRVAEKKEFLNLEVNAELAKKYLSNWQRLLQIFGHVKNIGEENFEEFLKEYGEDYAEYYEALGSRSYQANNARVTSTIIESMQFEESEYETDIRILDLASGPEMLRKHISNDLQDSVTSVDINKEHFKKAEGKTIYGSFVQLPKSIEGSSIDYVNLGLAWHYTKEFSLRKEEYERVETLIEINRVLKKGGVAIISMLYSLEINDKNALKSIIERSGFEMVEKWSGEVTNGSMFEADYIVLRKKEDIMEEDEELSEKELEEISMEDEIFEHQENVREKVQEIKKEERTNGIKFSKTKKQISKFRNIMTEFEIEGRKENIVLNKEDSKILREEKSILKRGKELIEKYEGIRNIPEAEIIQEEYMRYRVKQRKNTPEQNYKLIKIMSEGKGIVEVV